VYANGMAHSADEPVATSSSVAKPHCSASWSVQKSAGFNIPVGIGGSGSGAGNVELWYDSCSRDVKAQINGPAISAPGYSVSAEVITPSGTEVASCGPVDSYATDSAATCETGPVPDAGTTHKASGLVYINGEAGPWANPVTQAF
jgi:hypothetical protein